MTWREEWIGVFSKDGDDPTSEGWTHSKHPGLALVPLRDETTKEEDPERWVVIHRGTRNTVTKGGHGFPLANAKALLVEFSELRIDWTKEDVLPSIKRSVLPELFRLRGESPDRIDELVANFQP